MEKLTIKVTHETSNSNKDVTYTYNDLDLEDLIIDLSDLLIVLGYHPNIAKQFKEELVENMNELLEGDQDEI